ncbi:MAG TPA: hypothetical protein VIQ01_06360, partial [Burkholderiales bacterium]
MPTPSTVPTARKTRRSRLLTSSPVARFIPANRVSHMSTNLLGLDAAQLESYFASLGEKPFRARQVMRWMHRNGEADFVQMSDLAKT